MVVRFESVNQESPSDSLKESGTGVYKHEWSWLSEFIMYVFVGLLRSMPRQELWCKVFMWNVKEALSGGLVNEIGKRRHR